MQTNILRKIWAKVNGVCQTKETADFLLHCFLIVKFGKESLNDLSDEETGILTTWLDDLEDTIGRPDTV